MPTLSGTTPKIYVAVPMQDEWNTVASFMDCLRRQTLQNFKSVVCVNQPDDWWKNEHRLIAERNLQTLAFLQKQTDLDIHCIDVCSPGKGWRGKKRGVGWARKLCMDCIVETADPDDVIVSLDADTHFSPNYFAALQDYFRHHEDISALSVPYYHPLPEEESAARSLLIYECYMRHYFLNLKRIDSPYAFTALGSAIAIRVKDYVKTGGITPYQAGEDFYLLQKVVKTGHLATRFPEIVYPSSRFSTRVPFGTGKAIEQQQNARNEILFRFFEPIYFDEVKETFSSFPRLFYGNEPTPMDTFLKKQLNCEHIWEPLRSNFKSESRFSHACVEKVDALRILQYLKSRPAILSAEEAVKETCKLYGLPITKANFSFLYSPISELNEWRNLLFECGR